MFLSVNTDDKKGENKNEKHLYFKSWIILKRTFKRHYISIFQVVSTHAIIFVIRYILEHDLQVRRRYLVVSDESEKLRVEGWEWLVVSDKWWVVDDFLDADDADFLDFRFNCTLMTQMGWMNADWLQFFYHLHSHPALDAGT